MLFIFSFAGEVVGRGIHPFLLVAVLPLVVYGTVIGYLRCINIYESIVHKKGEFHRVDIMLSGLFAMSEIGVSFFVLVSGFDPDHFFVLIGGCLIFLLAIVDRIIRKKLSQEQA